MSTPFLTPTPLRLPSCIYCPCYLAPGPALGQGEQKGGTLRLSVGEGVRALGRLELKGAEGGRCPPRNT